MTKVAPSLLADARVALQKTPDYDAFVTRLSVKDRANTAKHLTALEAGVDGAVHVKTWKRIAATMASLTASDVRTLSGHAVMYFVVDGQYRMQILALNDANDGKINVYCGDILAEAVAAKLIKPDAPSIFRVGASDLKVTIEKLDGTSRDLLPFCKNLIGWNRHAVRIVIPADAPEAVITTALEMCAMTAVKVSQKSAK